MLLAGTTLERNGHKILSVGDRTDRLKLRWHDGHAVVAMIHDPVNGPAGSAVCDTRIELSSSEGLVTRIQSRYSEAFATYQLSGARRIYEDYLSPTPSP
jgi:hypothetical protein